MYRVLTFTILTAATLLAGRSTEAGYCGAARLRCCRPSACSADYGCCKQQCHTVMKTCKEVVYEKKQYTCYKTCYKPVWETKTINCVKYVPETCYRECRYTVCKPVYETKYRTCTYTVCKPVWETRTK